MRLVTLFRLALLAAFLVAPMAMQGRHAAMARAMGAQAMGAASTTGAHCAEIPATHHGGGAPEKVPTSNIDCVIACACVPPVVGGLVAAPLFEVVVPSASRAAVLVSRNPAADPPPPRA